MVQLANTFWIALQCTRILEVEHCPPFLEKAAKRATSNSAGIMNFEPHHSRRSYCIYTSTGRSQILSKLCGYNPTCMKHQEKGIAL